MARTHGYRKQAGRRYTLPMHCLNRDEESERILAEYDSKLEPIMSMLERQFQLLHARAQVLLTLCGIVISTTGFSGRIIAGTNKLAQLLIVSGVGLVLLAAVLVAWGVLHLRWLTLQPGDTIQAWLKTSLKYRDRKTEFYRWGLIIMVIGLALYVGAIAVMLLRPHVDGLPAR